MTKDKAYEAVKKLGERAGHDETVLGKIQAGWRSVDTDAESPGDKINVEVTLKNRLPRIELSLHGLDVETSERIIDLVKERDAAVRLGAEVAETEAETEAEAQNAPPTVPVPHGHDVNFQAATISSPPPPWPRPAMTHHTKP